MKMLHKIIIGDSRKMKEVRDKSVHLIMENYEVYDRFTFDYLFKNLLQDGYDHEEAKDIIIHNCALSTLVMQERIYDNHYLEISVHEQISDDLLELVNGIFAT